VVKSLETSISPPKKEKTIGTYKMLKNIPLILIVFILIQIMLTFS
jgi:hypothetical protein